MLNEIIEIWGDGSIIRDFVYVGDVVRVIQRLLVYEGRETIFNVGSGHGYSISEVLAAVQRFTNRPLNVSFKPARPCDVPVNVLSIDRARRELAWEPRVLLEEGIKRMGMDYLAHV
jgi:UDP-glucose 4-epimerase